MKAKESKILEIMIALIVNLIIFSANNKLMMYTKHLALAGILLYLFMFALSRTFIIKVDKYKAIYSCFVFMIAVSCIYVSSVNEILDYSLYFVLGMLMVFSDCSRSFYYYFLKIFKGIFCLFIFSMFLESMLPEVFRILFGIVSFGDAEMRAMTSGGAIAGLAFEKAYAAFICNLGLGIAFSGFVRYKSKKFIIQIIVIMTALMMTGKRTLFIIPIAILLVYVILFSKNNKFIKLAGVGLGITAFIVIAYTAIPGAALIIDRIVNGSTDLLSGRETFWTYAMEMFHKNPIFGTGFLSFNEYAYNQGFLYYGDRWNYQAHNVYLQILGEMGIVGCILIVLLIGLITKKAVILAQTFRDFWSVLLVYWIILFGIYSLTGNTLYYPCQLIILFLCILFVSDNKKLREIPYKRNNN